MEVLVPLTRAEDGLGLILLLMFFSRRGVLGTVLPTLLGVRGLLACTASAIEEIGLGNLGLTVVRGLVKLVAPLWALLRVRALVERGVRGELTAEGAA